MSDWKNSRQTRLPWKIKKIEITDKEYPESLKKIKRPPKILYYRGNWNVDIFEKSIAVVGSRRVTRYGKGVIDKFIPGLVAENITIISGFMYGVDSLSHQKCLEFGGKTVAVLGSGLDVLYPQENEKLYSQILKQGGLMISEYEKDFRAALWTFPQRNRIVAGLSSLGTLIIEAGIKSGSLITARLTKEQKKEVFAVCGQIDSKVSEGTNWLIKTGQAKMVTEAADIFGKGVEVKTEQMDMWGKLDKKEREIVDLLSSEGLSIDEIGRKLGKNVAELSVITSMMQMKNLIEEEGGKFYLR
ncbi:DNA-processing protein DprA [Patescibacteria group bacterium]|nr:DNA-processing protein DprA [Patescibacteria group bacterium]